MPTSEQDARASAAATSASTGAVVTATEDNDRPDKVHPSYDRMKERWRKCRDLMIGTDAIRAGGTFYLPKFDQESDKAYEARRTIAAVYDGFKRTVKASAGMLLEKPPTLGDDMPGELKTLAENIDNAGTHLNVFTERIATDALTVGHAGILVEYPRVENPAAVDADTEKRLGLRPYWVMVRAEDIMLALYGKTNGATQLQLLVIREVADVRVGKFGVRSAKRYWVYRQEGATVTYECYEEPENGGAPASQGAPVMLQNAARIPFSPLVVGEKLGAMETIPPLYGLAELNLEHHRIKTGRESIQELAFVPTMVRVGYQPRQDPNDPGKLIWDPVLLGTRNVVDVPIIDGVPGDLKWLSPDVTVLEPSDKTLQDIKADMGAVGLSFLAPDHRVAETAEAKRIDSAAQKASLRSFAKALGDCLELAFQMTAAYLPGKPEVKSGSVTIHTDFEATIMDAAMVTALTSAASVGKLSLDTLLLLMEKGGILPEGFDREAEIRKILLEGGVPVPAASTGTDDDIDEDEEIDNGGAGAGGDGGDGGAAG